MTGAGDSLDRLWTPDRLAYVKGEAEPRSGYQTQAGCPFCRAPHVAEDDGLVVARGESVFAVLNLYPYNPGHLMICPYRHVADYTDLTGIETTELAHFTQHAMRVIRRVSGPDGFNLGMNQGATAGAGIAAHLHQHIVPRWGGDTNFMPVIGRTKVLPQLLGDTRRLLAEAWQSAPVAAAGTLRRTPTRANANRSAEPMPAKARSTAPKRAGTTTTKAAPATQVKAAQAKAVPAKQAKAVPAKQAKAVPAKQAKAVPAKQAKAVPAKRVPAKQAKQVPAKQVPANQAKARRG